MGESIGINSDSMISYDGIYFGFAPTYNPATTMATLNGDTGQKAATSVSRNVITSVNSDLAPGTMSIRSSPTRSATTGMASTMSTISSRQVLS